MTKKSFSLIALAASAFLAGSVLAASGTNVTFPIPELGNCTSGLDCKAYCDKPANRDACFAYAKEHSLMSGAQVSAAKAIIAKKGPGGCTTSDACKTYCSIAAHNAECISFAQSHNLIATSTAYLAQKITASGGPGGCKSGDQCWTYCSDVTHMDECKQFAQENGIKQQEKETQINQVLQEKPGPGGCKSPAECKQYCDTPAHGTLCRQFALDNGLITEVQFTQAQSFASTTGPGGCRGDACKTYCSDTTHRSECLDFAAKTGVITQETVNTAKRIDDILKIESGPGGCTSLDACKAYCSDATHGEECRAFATSHALIQPQPQNQPQPQSSGGTMPKPPVIQNGSTPTPTQYPYTPGVRPPQPTTGPSTGPTTGPSSPVQNAPAPTTMTDTQKNLYIFQMWCVKMSGPGTCSAGVQVCEAANIPDTISIPNASGQPTILDTKAIQIIGAKMYCPTATPPPTTTNTTQPQPTNTYQTQTLPPPPPPPTTTAPPPTTTTVPPPPTTSGTKIYCHTIDECKMLCGTNTANCVYAPYTTPTSTLGSAVITAIIHFIWPW